MRFRTCDDIISCEDAAQQVLMYVCPSVRPSVCGQFEIVRFLKVVQGYPRLPQVPPGPIASSRLSDVTQVS